MAWVYRRLDPFLPGDFCHPARCCRLANRYVRRRFRAAKYATYLTGGPLVRKTDAWPDGHPKHDLVPAGLFLLIPLPLILPPAWQVWTILLITLLMTVPGTSLMIGFNALLAATVPHNARGRVVGQRNALFAAATIISFLLSGWILDQLPFAWGYVAVFSLGTLGSALSTYHISRIKVPPPPEFKGLPLGDMAQPGRSANYSGDIPQRLQFGLRLWLRWRSITLGSLNGISKRYWQATGAIFFFHFAIKLPAVLFPLFWVREIDLSDGQIQMVERLALPDDAGRRARARAAGSPPGQPAFVRGWRIVNGFHPPFDRIQFRPTAAACRQPVGGLVWAILVGASGNRLLELTPEMQRPTHLTIYNLALNGGY